MEYETDAICVGSVLWDVIGRTNKPISRGGDVGGYISRIPGGVACLLYTSDAADE